MKVGPLEYKDWRFEDRFGNVTYRDPEPNEWALAMQPARGTESAFEAGSRFESVDN